MIKLLLGVRLRALFQSMFVQKSRKGKNRSAETNGKTSVGKIVLFAVLYLYLAGVFLFLFGSVFAVLSLFFSSADMQWAYFSMFAIISFAFQFLGSVFMTKNQLFDAKDNEFLLSLPVKPSDILASRMALLILYNFAFELIVALPAGLFWAISGTATAMGWIAFFLTVFAMPFFSLAISGLFAWIISRIAMHVKNKTAVTVILALAFFAIYFYFIGNAENAITFIALQMSSFAVSLKSILPLYWAGASIAEGNILYLSATLLIYLLPFVLMFWILQKNFFQIALSSGTVAKRTHVLGKGTQATADTALLRREFGRLGASANYILNTCMSIPFMLVATVALILKKTDFMAVFEGSGLDLPIGNIVGGIAILALSFLQSMGLISAPSVSLEGKTIETLHALPVDGKKFLLAKLKLHWILTVPVTFACALAFAIAFRPDLPITLLLLTYPVLYAVWGGNIGLICGINHPMMEWTNEVQPIKQGVAVLLTMLFNSFPTLLIVGGGIVLYFINGYLAVAGVLGITILGDILSYRWIMSRGVQKWDVL